MTVQIHCSGGFVTRVLATGVTAVLFVILLSSLTYSLEGGPLSDLGQSFLQKAAQGHYAQVVLGCRKLRNGLAIVQPLVSYNGAGGIDA